MALFKAKRIGGVEYALDHLEPFQFKLECGEETFTIEVEFSCHCFTETLADRHRPDVVYTHGNERRAFDLSRYECSKSLPSLIEGLGSRSVYYSQQVNYFFLRKLAHTEEADGPYVVYFNPERATRKPGVDVRLLVQSAYCKPNMVDQASPVSFTTLVASTAKGKLVRRGPKQRIKRK